MAYDNSNCLVWLDIEMTGLNIEKDSILEIACIITDKSLKIITEEFNVVINHSDEVLENMNEWCMNTHYKTGLVQECKSSTTSLKEAEQMFLNYVKKYIPKNTCPIAGNTVYNDRLFLRKYMPLVSDYFHYRIIDVSTIKELTRMWYPKIFENSPKESHKAKCHHRAFY
ncbi:PREDICTED: probable oligoribonuclease [Habropoda laboriosa]|uniref:probable oligoribonuclease n=1 Tax=Habropoda laboriosa TaxID=597456 RepID=UPI00083D1105|nr:PREDICTED: probable oligoribonuclease [Habropoda laboriosa]